MKFRESFELRINRDKGFRTRESSDDKTKEVLVVTAEVIHAGTTANYTHYSQHELQASIRSWTYPYLRPVLLHHNSWNGEPIGRVVSARWVQTGRFGKPCIETVAEITDPDAIEKIKDGRYHTISVGGSAEHIYCSICHADITEDWCEHRRGRDYDGITCEWILGDITWEEWSFVNTPADEFAGLIDYTTKQQSKEANTSGSEESNMYAGISIKDSFICEKQDNQLQEGGKNVAVEEQLKTVKEERDALKEQLSTSENTITALTEERDQVKTQLEEKEKELAESVEKARSFESKVQELEEKLQVLENEKAGLAEECQRLAEEHHKHVAEQVVDTKIALGRIVAEQRDEAIASHMARTIESLRDALHDLSEEKITPATPPKLNNPGIKEGDNFQTDQQDGPEPDADAREALRAALKKAFSGVANQLDLL